MNYSINVQVSIFYFNFDIYAYAPGWEGVEREHLTHVSKYSKSPPKY